MLGFFLDSPRAIVAAMNTATPFPWPGLSTEANADPIFRAFFEHSPMAVARCNSDGVLVEMNPAFERGLEHGKAGKRPLRLRELIHLQDGDKTDLLLREFLDSARDTICIQAAAEGNSDGNVKWTAWRQAGCAGERDHALVIVEQAVDSAINATNDSVFGSESPMQIRRWEAIGRLAGGVAHDFNNLLTGVMLYCDLLLSSLDARDRRRRYADEIRSAIMHASGLVRQLILCARPQAVDPGLLSLNEVAETMRDLFSRMIGDSIILELRLDPELGPVKIARAQAQQILLNLVLNARDALPHGGRITVETRNCGFQPVGGASPCFLPSFPSVLLTVRDNGRGMDAETRQHLFEPFFTTKSAGENGGLGLTTVRSIVATNHGLIHFESEPGHGTCAMILFPRSVQPAGPEVRDTGTSNSELVPPTPFQKVKKESLV